MSKPYEQYLPKKEKTKLVQIHLDLESHKALKEILDKNGWSWGEFLKGLTQKYLDDQKIKKPKAG